MHFWCILPLSRRRGLSRTAEAFMNNISCTWNVVSAARRAGVTDIVWASSETVLGLPFDTPPPYIPVDEDTTPARVRLFTGQDP